MEEKLAVLEKQVKLGGLKGCFVACHTCGQWMWICSCAGRGGNLMNTHLLFVIQRVKWVHLTAQWVLHLEAVCAKVQKLVVEEECKKH